MPAILGGIVWVVLAPSTACCLSALDGCYEVWGLEAIGVRYVDDPGTERMIRIGTDDADGLDAALKAARSA